MRSIPLVALTQGLDDDLRFVTKPEPLEVQALVSELPVEALVCAVLPRPARIDERRVDLVLREPIDHGCRDELTCLPFIGSAESWEDGSSEEEP